MSLRLELEEQCFSVPGEHEASSFFSPAAMRGFACRSLCRIQEHRILGWKQLQDLLDSQCYIEHDVYCTRGESDGLGSIGIC